MRRIWWWVRNEVFDSRKRGAFGASIITVGVWSLVLSRGGPLTVAGGTALAVSLLLIPLDWRAFRRFLKQSRGRPADPDPRASAPTVSEPPSNVRQVGD